jgi:hypothetical protein
MYRVFRKLLFTGHFEGHQLRTNEMSTRCSMQRESFRRVEKMYRVFRKLLITRHFEGHQLRTN